MAEPLLKLDDLAVHFTVGGALRGGTKILKAVDGVSLDVKPGECLGLVGESGCGKSTLALAIMGLIPPTHGGIALNGQAISGRDRMATARTVQMVFQDPYASLNPRQTVRRTLADPLRLHGVTNRSEVDQRVADMMAKVGLRPDHADRYPHEFSGGQRQRIGIARALILQPKLVICDEPVSALDVSIRAQIMNLLKDLQAEHALAYLLVAHNLATVRYIAHRTAVMYLGQIVEYAATESVYRTPLHPYTKALFAAALPADPDAPRETFVLSGEVPSPIDPPTGCRFHPRCPSAMEQCAQVAPTLKTVAPDHEVSCHLY